MSKKFFEVFPTLKLDRHSKDLMGECQVLKVVTNFRKDKLRIYLEGNHIIAKKEIYAIEEEIKTQLFQKVKITIEIIESFSLSNLYTPSYIFKEYYESFLYELANISVIERNMLLNGKTKFLDDNTLCLDLEDNIVSKEKSKALEAYLVGVYEKRFHKPITLSCSYVPREDSFHEENKVRIKQEVKEILKNSKEVDEQKEEETPKHKKRTFAKKGFKGAAFIPQEGMVYGRGFEEDAIPLSSIQNEENGAVVVRGQVMKVEAREIKNERTILIFDITDFTDSIRVKIFVKNEQLADILGEVKKGNFLLIKGMTILDMYDKEITLSSVTGIKKIADFTTSRKDTAFEKRVELHCHTKMSDMDAIASAADMVKRAYSWGHKAIAITDHGVVQAFPEALHALDAIKKNDPETDFKVIYGVEAYIVDDLKDIALREKGQDFDDTYIVFDLETTGFSAIKNKIIEIGAVKVVKGEIVDTFSTFVNPKVPIPFQITKLTSITDQMVADAKTIEEILPEFLEFVKDGVLVAHNAGFDVGFIEQNMRYQEIEQAPFTVIDTISLARILLPTLGSYKLNTVAKALKISLENHHRAVDDATATAEIFIDFRKQLLERNITTLKELNKYGAGSEDIIKKERSYHCIILVKNETGRLNLYKLVSNSHLKHYYRRPRIPKSELSKFREGLIVGSACEAGELYQALLNDASNERVARIVDYYDYLEVQPVGNNAFMIDSERISKINSKEDIQAVNKRIVELGETFHKPVVATCDVHFMDPEDQIYRAIIMAGKGFDDADNQPPLYLHTTDEMLEEFEYLGSKKAKEIVIDNPNKIAQEIASISPIHPDKCPPVIEHSEEQLRDICYKKAHEMYGKDLPEIVSERLERELNSIISNGYAVMYIIAQKLVWKSVEDGYLVGSRGSVGSSFVATMAGITEVNPLSPHYYCSSCYYSDFESEEVQAFAGGCGFDMPDKVCPNCGKPLIKDGFDIPFETFLGFKGDKEPDIDLNFSGDYQAKAHKYTEEIFGTGQTFKAGTVGTLAEKTAFGFVKKYYEEKGINKRSCEIDRIVSGCTGIRRSTGQHPGGIIVLPHGRDINEFTPVQHPANDMNTDIITTHFDYHSIDKNLLKLDILGHDDPTMIKALEEYINSDALDNEYNEDHPFKATEIPLDDKGVMSLFHDTSALKISPKDISGTPLGCLGIPEFGTDFVIQMVIDAKPSNLSDLIRISGLSHGTDVWLNNAQELIRQGKATISSAICTRDDIMTFLINQGMEPALSFSIMEGVRKGKGLKPEQEKAMIDGGIPDWYIWSCKKIKYMFPKAHAAAYVMMAYRIAYCKIYYPLAYYGAFFGIRADAFSYEIMCQGKEKLNYYIADYKKRSNQLTKKEEDTLKDMRLVQEMYARGYEFLPIDIYKSKAKEFQIVDGKLLPPLISIEGLGEKAAQAVYEDAVNGPYLSQDDFRIRTKASKTVIETMARLGILGDIPVSNQLSLFDL